MGGDIDDATVCTERLIVVDVTVVVSHSRKNGPLCRARATEPAAFEGALGETDCTMRSTREGWIPPRPSDPPRRSWRLTARRPGTVGAWA
jgi:hypothetical protein